MSTFRSLEVEQDLEQRIRRIHRRHRRAQLRELVTLAGWGAGLLVTVVFVVALALGATAR